MSEPIQNDEVSQLRADLRRLQDELARVTVLVDGGEKPDEEEDEGLASPEESNGRRRLFKMAGAATLGAVGAGLLTAAPANAADGGNMLIGEINKAKATTQVTTKGGIGLQGVTSADGAANGAGLYGADQSTGGSYGVVGTSVEGVGVQGNSENGNGVTGLITGNTSGFSAVDGLDESGGGGYGVYGSSAAGTGVIGIVSGDTTGQRAVHGTDRTNGGGYGVYGSSNEGTGVYGTAGPIGVSGVASFDGGYGVFAKAPGSGGCGVYAEADGDDGDGVYAYAPGDNGYGVYVVASGSNGCGVYAEASEAAVYGVFGVADGENAAGVYCESSQGLGLYVAGNAEVVGSLSKGSGSFKIDHPLDPANKYLYHSFVESPDMMNVYNGTVVLDRDGKATVRLPDWFEALNRDFRYQLTAIGGAAPNLHISSKVADGAFSIAGANEGQEVSWQVTGIRQDAFANAHRIPVEVDKSAEDQGRYLHPEVFVKGDEHVITAMARARSQRRMAGRRTP